MTVNQINALSKATGISKFYKEIPPEQMLATFVDGIFYHFDAENIIASGFDSPITNQAPWNILWTLTNVGSYSDHQVMSVQAMDSRQNISAMSLRRPLQSYMLIQFLKRRRRKFAEITRLSLPIIFAGWCLRPFAGSDR
jgi:hypothetical protein